MKELGRHRRYSRALFAGGYLCDSVEHVATQPTRSAVSRRARSTIVALAAALAALCAPTALAGYPVQPSDGATLSTLAPTFLIYLDSDEIRARVDISSVPQTGYSGSLILGPGYLGSCDPLTPFGEPRKFTCSLRFAREGTYYWQFVYDKYICETVFGFQSCHYRRQYGPVWRFDLKLAAAPVGAALPTLRGPSRSSRRDPLYTQIATEIAQTYAPVYCWSATDWNAIHVRRREERGEGLEWVLGYVPRGSREINLAPEVCNRLDAIAYRRQRPRGAARIHFAEAVDTLAHEAIHALGVIDEARTECYSLQLIDWTAMKLGTNHAYARDLSGLAWSVLYPRIPSQYRTEDCYDGGPLDLFPTSNVWP